MNDFDEKYYEVTETLKAFYDVYTSKVSTDGMAISLKVATFMYFLCDKYKFRYVMDRGSGFSSFVLRFYAKKQLLPITVFSVDDSEEWLNKTESFLKYNYVDSNNLFLWDDFYSRFKNNLKFDFILEDAKKYLRVKTPNELTSFIKEDGMILWDDAKVHSGLIGNQCMKKAMYMYNIKHLTLDDYGRYAALTTKRELKEFEKI